ncbi:MAG: hypothetical protein Q8K86_11645 [Candidatus Nanopelagicaceae bacterium]|nr:hypothetical protein [Candidatus Nanopelagicaceae bacterium]
MNVIELILVLDAVVHGEGKQIPLSQYQRWFLERLVNRGFDGGTPGALLTKYSLEFVEELNNQSDYSVRQAVQLIKQLLEETK